MYLYFHSTGTKVYASVLVMSSAIFQAARNRLLEMEMSLFKRGVFLRLRFLEKTLPLKLLECMYFLKLIR